MSSALSSNGAAMEAKAHEVSAEGFEEYVQERIARARPGDVIELPAGKFTLERPLTLTTRDLVLRGQGSSRTRLDFSRQESGAQSLLVMGAGIAVEGLAIVDPLADGLVARNSGRITVSDVSVEWITREISTRGGYGIYPINCSDVTIERSFVQGAREAGIYVGQTLRGMVRDNRVEKNVVGIDIENSHEIQVEGNQVRDNSVGIVVSARPNLFQPRSHGNRIGDNRIAGNNRENFAEKTSHLAVLGDGRGLMVISSSKTVIEGNRFEEHRSSHAVFLNYLSLGLRISQPDPYFMPDLIDNRLSGNSFIEDRSIVQKRGETWRDASGWAVVWDGISSAFPRSAASMPVPVCSADRSVFSVFDATRMSGSIPRCAAVKGK
ncbi:MAG: right-handed parallel beta-helix repeat-containing protein [Deltaproteobacteria bacterium]|nr:right-handed parallel beta-helix repeat-containing protein [Deltaproteobacteria bacterium]